MSAPAICQLIGRWRIVETDLWGRSYLDLVVPAALVAGTNNHGEIAFDALQVSLDLGYSPSTVFFAWQGSDEMHEVDVDSSAGITFAYHNSNAAILKAKRDLSSTMLAPFRWKSVHLISSSIAGALLREQNGLWRFRRLNWTAITRV